jgi:ATP-dependent DNA helicase HFM1/MER3
VTPRLITVQTFEAGKGVDLNLKAEVAFMNDSVPTYFAKKPIYVVLLAETSDGHTIFFMRSSLVWPSCIYPLSNTELTCHSAKKLGNGQEFRFKAHLISPSQSVICHVMCDEIGNLV